MSGGSTQDGFAVDLSELDKAANQCLPAAADVLRPPGQLLATYEGLEGSVRGDAAGTMPAAYGSFTWFLGDRQRRICDVIDATAQALQEIAEVYRRTDGAG